MVVDGRPESSDAAAQLRNRIQYFQKETREET